MGQQLKPQSQQPESVLFWTSFDSKHFTRNFTGGMTLDSKNQVIELINSLRSTLANGDAVSVVNGELPTGGNVYALVKIDYRI